MSPGGSRRNGKGGPGAVALIANYESDVGYAWWLMENFWVLLARTARAQGRRCVLAYPKVHSIPVSIQTSPIEVVEASVSYRGCRAMLTTARFLKAQRVSTVYLTDWPYLHVSYLLWRLIGVRRIVNHDHPPGVRPPARSVRALAKRLLHATRLLSCHQYVAVSRFVASRLAESACVPPRRCVTVENGLVPFDLPPGRRSVTRDLWAIPEDAFVVALVSRATFYKGLDFAIEVMALLKEEMQGRPLRVLHCGGGPDVESLRTLAADAGLAEHFQFLGKRDDVADILAAADVAFHPSRGEAMSLAILEFMCAGLPVVVSDNPSVSAAITDDVSGLVYRAEDRRSALRALVRLKDDPALRARLGANGRYEFLTKHLLSNTNDSFTRQVCAKL